MQRETCKLFRYFLLIFVAAVFTITAISSSPAVEKSSKDFRFQYAAKLLCTANIPGTSQTTPSVLPGVYKTAVNIHNPNDQTVRWRRKISQPELGFSKFIEDQLKPDETARVTCDQIQSDFGPFIHGVEGFLVIESTQSLDVIGVYTAGKNGGEVESIDVKDIRERRID
ncbi:MAG: hypothetical protein ACOZFS_10655 [Thermodesulfobacteriota bacterium]